MDRRLFLCLTALCLATITTATDEDPKETENIECKQDGFLPHPTNCRAYYWCSLRRRVRAIILECEDDEIFDTQSQKCTYPNLSTRKECGGTKHLTDAFSIKPRSERSFDAQLRNQPNGCSKEEFVGDENDCSKFYRCVNNGGGQFAKYEFSCAPGTVWDSDISSCNHQWAVKSKCGNGLINSSPSQNYPPMGEYEQYPVAEQPYPIKNPDPYPIYQQQLPQGMQNPDYGGYKPIPYPPQSQEGYNPSSQYPQNEYKPNPYPEQPPKETKPIEQPSKPSKPEEGNYNPNPIYERPQGGYEPSNEYNFQQQQNQEKPSSPAPTSPEPEQPSGSSDKAEESSKAPPVIDNEINSDSTECQAEGFVPDSKDCKKFYRCIENGERRFIKYEFTCGQGTVWDPQINACNHEWAVKKNNCKYKIDQANNEASEKPSTPVNQYGNETTEQENGNKDEKPSNKEPVGEGGSTSQEYNSTSPTNEYGSSSTDGPHTSTTTTAPRPSTITTGQNNSITTEKNPSVNGEKEHQEISYECTKDGFIPDKNDCKKFYRCVNNEKRGFIKYEFSCGQGTVWDPDANTCNFPGATRNKCGKGTESSSSNSTRPIGNENTTEKGPVQVDSSENTNSTTTQQSSSGFNENGSANKTTTSENNPESTNNTTSNSTEEEKHQLKGECRNEEDYIPDKHDCKKFYRCVKSSKDGFTKYEFSCGQGTVWDPDTKTCNYPWATRNKCGTGQGSGSTDSSYNNSSNENGSSNTTSEVSTSEAPVSGTDNKEQGSSNICPDGKYCETTSGSSTSSPNSENHTEKGPTEIVEQSTGQNNISTTEEKPNSTDQISNTSTVAQYDNCVSDGGFIGDSKNCKKFYRCVANEQGSFTKYEFTCGEGTVWDSIVNTCNHPSAVKGNCSNKNVNSEEASTSEAPAAGQNGTLVEEKENVLTTEKATEQPEITSVSETSSTESGNKETQSEVSNTQPASTEQSAASESTTIVSSSSNTQQPSTGESSEQSPVTDSTTETSTSSESGNKETSTQPSSTEGSSEQSPATDTTAVASSSEAGNKETSTQPPSTEGSSEQSPATDTTTVPSSSESGNKETSTQQPSNGVSSEQSPTTASTSNETTEETNSTLTNNIPTSTEKNPTETSPANQEGPTSEKINKCTKEGFFPNMEHCNKFYRCVSNGMGGYTKYDFDCGGGTIWDPDLDTCNHPYAVTNKKCEKGQQQQQSKGECTTEGYFASNKDCKNFYRCVNNGNGQYTKYDFMCGNNTIWDTNTHSCNHPWVTVNKVCGHRGDNIPPSPIPEQETKTEPPKETSSVTPPTTEVINNTTEQEIVVTTVSNQQTTLDVTTESQTETPDKEITEGQTTENQKEITDISSQPSEQTTTTEKSTTPLVNVPETTTSGITETTESTGTTDFSYEPTASSSESIDSSSIEPSTSTDSTSVDFSTSTDSSSSTETASTESSSSTETASTVSSSSTETASTETAPTDSSSSTETISTESSSTETASTESPSTETASSSYTETASTDPSASTETGSTDSSSESPQTVTDPPQEANQTAPCPISQLEGDQMALVCPTGFKRHPKYCNLFYQCTSNPDTFDINVLVISCPGRRIYDDLKIQCLPPEESDQECTGQIAEKEQLRKFGSSVSPMEMESEEPLCPNEGNFPLHPTECNNHFVKCEKSSSRPMRGFMYVCPENFSYWPVSKKCERLSPALPCVANPVQEKIWQIPVEIEIDPIDVRIGA